MQKQITKQVKNTGITKDTIIADILEMHPDKAILLSEIMMEFGIHCVGCGANAFETLEQGVLGHGYSEKDLNRLLVDLNKAANSKAKSKNTNKNTINSSNFSLILTSKAIKKLNQIISDKNKQGSYLRATVLAGGCSGYTYDLEIVEKKANGDIEFDQGGIKVLVDTESAEFLNGTSIDFIDTLNESGFKFQNPNATKSCGCGKSFS
ncbi:iron-sulfur cluster assembly accessory protein [Candidatus Pacearchaeota archaeon]|nr:iron-sulfur cluster assembly accessory protein [Candidatus Pacearchaeota archaeon]